MKNTSIKVSRDLLTHVKALALPGESYDATLRRVIGMEQAALSRARYKYPFVNLNVREQCFIPWPDETHNRARPSMALDKFISRTGRQFYIDPTSKGLKITRIK